VPPADPPESFEQPATPAGAPEPRRISRRSKLVGSIVALLVLAGLGWLAWSLTHPDEAATAQSARGGAGGGPGGPGGGPGGPGGGGPGGPGGGRGGPGGPGGRGPATTVGVAVAESADIPVNLEALGTVVPQATVRVRPQVSGVLQQVLFKEGQVVKKGQLLAVIDPRPFEMALQQAQGQRMREEAQLAAARETLARFETLLRQDSIARQEVDTQRATVRQFEAALMTNRANEGTARLNLGYARITAPIDGRLGLRAVDVGNTVGPSDANGIATITQLTPIDVEFAIPQDHASWLQQNAGAFMEVKTFDRTRTTLLDTGVFSSLDNQIDPQTGTVRAKARFNNARGQLFPSQFVNVQLQVRVIRDAVVVPVSAVRQGSGGEHVFVLQDNRTVQMRPVVRGQPLGDRVQLASGLQVGERVVTEGADRLRDGSRVMLPGDAPGQGAGGGRRRGGGAAGPGGPGGPPVPDGAPARPAPPPEAAAPAPAGSAAAAAAPRREAPAPAASAAARRASAPAAAPNAAPPAAGAGLPTPEQRQRMLDAAKDNPEQLERRKRFLDALDRGDPEAMERWQRMQQRQRERGGAGARDGQ
jgi:multidrug efflux system membrane fusion protein